MPRKQSSHPRSGSGRMSVSGRSSGTSSAKISAKSSGRAPGKVKARKVSPKMQRVYRRRRIVAIVALPLMLALVVFCVYSLFRGAIGMHEYGNRADIMSISRASSPPEPAKHSEVQDCSVKDLELQLTPSSQTIPVGGSVEFTATMLYSGTNTAGCYVDGAHDNLLLTITSGNERIWRSDACGSDPRPLLMYTGAKDESKFVWNADRSGAECVPDEQLPRVDRGTYVAQLSLKDNPKVQGTPVTIEVQ